MDSRSPNDIPLHIEISGRRFARAEIAEIRKTCGSLRHLSRSELVETLCEHLDWRRPDGSNKVQACAKALNKLEELGLVEAPPVRKCRARRPRPARWTAASDPGAEIAGRVDEIEPVSVEPVTGSAELRLWKEWVSRWHYLGFRQGFGARQAYFIRSGRYADRPLGCLLYAASAWKVGCRDAWIGWDKRARTDRLHLVLNQSRFLILPWVRCKNLASRALGLSARRVAGDWQERYGFRPVLLEAFVDPSRYDGTCYRASNWEMLGLTVGTSRSHRDGDPLTTRKKVFVFPLRPDFRAILLGETER